MAVTTTGLKDLHQLHLKLADAKRGLDRGPKRIASCEKAIAAQQKQIADLQEQLKTLRMAVDKKNLQLNTNEGNIQNLKAKLNQASSNREYEIIDSQIKADTVANSTLEDEILEAMGKVDAMNQTIADAEAESKSLQEKKQQTVDQITADKPGLLKTVDAVQEQLAEAEKIIPSTIKVDYTRLVQTHGADALAAVSGMACQCCYEEITRQKLVNLNTNQFVFCTSCGRLLYNEAD